MEWHEDKEDLLIPDVVNKFEVQLGCDQELLFCISLTLVNGSKIIFQVRANELVQL